MKIERKGSFEDDAKAKTAKRLIEVEENERLEIWVVNTGTKERVDTMHFFMPGVLTLTWEQGAKI